MNAMDADAPSKPFGRIEEYTFTPMAPAIVFAARDVGREEAWSTNFDLFFAPIDGSAPPQESDEGESRMGLVPGVLAGRQDARVSRDEAPGYESDRFRIVLRSWPDGKSAC